MADPAYSLSIELSIADAVSGAMQGIESAIDSGLTKLKQFKSELADFGGGISDINKQVSKLTDSFSLSVDNLTEINSAIEKIRSQGTGLEGITEQQEAFEKLGDIYDDLNSKSEKTVEINQTLVKIATARESFDTKIGREAAKLNKLVVKNKDMLARVGKDKKAIHKLGGLELKTLIKIVKEATRLQKIDKAGLKMSKDQLGLLKKRLDMRKGMGGLAAIGGGGKGGGAGAMAMLGKAGPWGKVAAVIAGAVTKAFSGLWGILKDLISTADKYRLTGMRLAGTISEVTKMHLNMQTQFGFTNKEMDEGIKNLIRYGAQSKELNTLLETSVKFTVATGASSEATAKFMVAMRGATNSTADAEKAVHMITIASRKFGLTSQEVNAHLTVMSQNMFTLNTLFGSKAAGKFNEGLLAIRAAEKAAGVEGAGLNELFQDMLDPASMKKGMVLFRHMEGGWGRFMKVSAKDPTKGMKMMVDAINLSRKEVGKLTADMSDDAAVAMQAELAALIDRTGISLKQFGAAEQFVMDPKRTKKMLEGMSGIKNEAAEFEDAYKEATDTVQRHFVQIWNKIKATLGKVMEPLVTKILPKFLTWVENIVTGISAGKSPLGAIVGGFGDVLGFIKPIGEIVAGLSMGLEVLLWPLKQMVKLATSFAGWLGIGYSHAKKARDLANIKKQEKSIDEATTAQFKYGSKKAFGFDSGNEMNKQMKVYNKLLHESGSPLTARNKMIDQYVKKLGLSNVAAGDARAAIMKGIQIDKLAAKEGEFKIKLTKKQIMHGDELLKRLKGFPAVEKAVRTALGKTTAETIVTAKVHTEEIKSREDTSKKANEKIEEELATIVSKVDPSVMRKIAALLEEYLPQMASSGGLSPISNWRSS